MTENGRINSDQALQALMEGNERFVSANLIHLDQTIKRRTEASGAQHPLAVILSCSDSQVPPEIVFDQEPGDLFVIRIAGHVINEAVLGSAEYAVEHLGPSLIMVMGHKRCGAVAEALKTGEAAGHLQILVESLKPAVRRGKGIPGDPLDNAVKANIEMVVHHLRTSRSILAERVEKNKLRIVGASYDSDTGRVDIIIL